VTTGVHEAAVNGAIDAARGLTPADAPLLELARTLARQVDAAGPGGPGTRLAATYGTAVRSLTTRLSPLVNGSGSSKLASLRAERGKPKPSKKRRRPPESPTRKEISK